MTEAVKGDNPTKEQQAVIEEIAQWIDTTVIAQVIAEELVDYPKPVTVEHCKATWMRLLEDLHYQARYAITEDL